MLPDGGKLTLLHDGMGFTEGPVWFRDLKCLIWSDIPGNRLHRWTPDGHVSVFRDNSRNTNGNTRDRQGRLISCEHGGRQVSRTEPDGTVTTLASKFEGKLLNSPNDAVVKSDNTIWFTDPAYGLPSGVKSEQAHENVYRLDPASGTLTAVVSDFDKPNGLAFSPDEQWLYIADSARSNGPERNCHLRRFKVHGDGTLSGGEIFVTTDGIPDGLRLDTEGNIWTSAGPKIDVYAPDATLLGQITGFAADVTNLTFGDGEIFVTGGHTLHSVKVSAKGCQTP
jgi:gluconolactonase